MKLKLSAGILNTLVACCVALPGQHCGFFAQPRVSEYYLETFSPDDEVECLVTWPIHAVALPVTATIDQGARTVEATVPAGRDALDFFLLEIGDDNIMLSRTLAVPKLMITPGIFVGSYLTRWLIPLDDEDRPFGNLEEFEDSEVEANEAPAAEADDYERGDSSSRPRPHRPPWRKPSPPNPEPAPRSPKARVAPADSE